MDEWINNLLNESILKENVQFGAMFILNYECLKDFVVNQIKDFFACSYEFHDGEMVSIESERYKRKVRKLDKNIDNASLKWFLTVGAITDNDYELYQKIRNKRNKIVHEFMKNLECGFLEDDKNLLNDMIKLYSKLDKWWIKEIEMPTSADETEADYDQEGVIGGQALFLSAINEIIILGNGEKYYEIMKEIKKND